MKFFLIAYIVLYINCSLAAESYIDSLFKVYEVQNNDSLSINTISNIARYFSTSTPDSAFKYIDELRTIAERFNHESALVKSDMIESIAYTYLGDMQRANELLHTAEANAIKIDDKILLNEIFLTLGINYLRMGVFDKSLDYLIKSKDLAEQTDNPKLYGRTLISIGLFHRANSNHKKELEYLRRAEKVFKDINDELNLSVISSNYVNTFLAMGELDSAIHYVDFAIKLAEKNDNQQSLSILYHNKAAIYYDLEDYPKAITFMEKSIKIKEKLNNPIGVAISKFSLGEIQHLKGDDNNAIKNIKEAIEVFIETNSLPLLMKAYRELDDIYFKKNDFQNAYKYSTLANNAKDSIFNESKQKTISELNSKYNLANKEKENEILKRLNQKKNFTILITLLVIGIVIFFAIILYMRHRALQKINSTLNSKNQMIEKQNEELELLNSELTDANNKLHNLNATKDRFFSIISHDLKGPISASQQLIGTIKSQYKDFSEEERIEYFNMLYDSTLNTYELLENLLTWSGSQRNKINYEPVLMNIHQIVDITVSHLSSIANRKNISINNKIEEDLNIKADVNMISTIFRNIINNSIKFTPEGGQINISSQIKENEVIFSVTDNGVGMDDKISNNLFKIDKVYSTPGTNNEKGTGLGLIIVKEFVDKHDGNIWVVSEVGVGSKFSFSIPVI